MELFISLKIERCPVGKQYITLLRSENFAAALVFLTIYGGLGGDWSTFAYLFLLPDLAFLAYLFGPRVGAYGYNATHSYIGPALLLLLAQLLSARGLPASQAPQLALIWLTHVAVDRALGFGLKSTEAFHITHLGDLKFRGRPRDADKST
jgi:hypothetical protein